MPARQCSRVDLPDPLGPMIARISPGLTVTLAPRRAGVWPKDLMTSRASTRGGRVTTGLFIALLRRPKAFNSRIYTGCIRHASNSSERARGDSQAPPGECGRGQRD